MRSNFLIWAGLFVGSAIGGVLPTLWGADIFSMWSVILTAVGGALGVWAGFKLSTY